LPRYQSSRRSATDNAVPNANAGDIYLAFSRLDACPTTRPGQSCNTNQCQDAPPSYHADLHEISRCCSTSYKLSHGSGERKWQHLEARYLRWTSKSTTPSEPSAAAPN